MSTTFRLSPEGTRWLCKASGFQSLSLPLVPTLMALLPAPSPTSTCIVAASTGQNFHYVMLVPEAPTATPTYV